MRYIQDDLRRLPRNSLASEVWMEAAREKTAALLRGLAALPEGRALAGLHVACGVYGEWHYWGFMRNEPLPSTWSRPFDRVESFPAWNKLWVSPTCTVPSGRPTPGVRVYRADRF